MAAEKDTQNLLEVKLKDAIRLIEVAMECKNYGPMCIIGKAGVGKTQGIQTLCEEHGWNFYEVRLVNHEVEDLTGLPYLENNSKQNGKVTRFAQANLLPPMDLDTPAILLLDEVTSVDESKRTVVMQLTDSSRRLGEYKLPETCKVICCGNGPDDGGYFQGCNQAFMTRGSILRVRSDSKDWRAWGQKHGIHPTILAYIASKPDALYPDVDLMSNPYNMIANPRTWANLSTMLKNMEQVTQCFASDGRRIKILDDNDIRLAACSCLGHESGLQFATFYALNEGLINPYDIMEGRYKNLQESCGFRRGDGGSSVSKLYITIETVINIIGREFKDPVNFGNDGSIKTEVIEKLAHTTNFFLDITEESRDLGIMAIQEMVNQVSDVAAVVLSNPAFDTICPRFTKFASDNAFSLAGQAYNKR